MRNLRLAAVALGCTLLTVSGCTSSNEKADRRPSLKESCTKLLSKDGMQWLKSKTKGRHLVGSTPSSISAARASFRRQVLSWDPPKPGGIPSFRTFSKSELCEARHEEKADPWRRKFMRLEYGASMLPFDFPFEQDFPKGEKPTVAYTGPDVKLVYKPQLDSPKFTNYQVYIKCAVPGAPKGHLNEVPLEGSLGDTVTGDPSHRTHFQYLLHSAKVMADGFKCTNNPQIPTTLPASVKD